MAPQSARGFLGPSPWDIWPVSGTMGQGSWSALAPENTGVNYEKGWNRTPQAWHFRCGRESPPCCPLVASVGEKETILCVFAVSPPEYSKWVRRPLPEEDAVTRQHSQGPGPVGGIWLHWGLAGVLG